ncbi:MAG: AI-2E family transporter [Candidatus Marinimicrobia bacterium]|nr:AI-2E family transporter [Candidatus Neomarinimicrobiota bacterium]
MPPGSTTSRKLAQFLMRGAQFIVPLLAIMLLWKHISPILMLMVMALLLASILAPLVDFVESRLGGSRIGGVLAVYVTIISLIVAMASMLIPILIEEASDMASAFQGQSLETLAVSLKNSLTDVLPPDAYSYVEANMGTWLAKSGSFIQSLLGDLAGIMGKLFAMVMNMVLVLVFTFILLLESRNFKMKIIGAVPNAYFEMAMNLLHKIDGQVSGYLRGQGAAAATVGVLSTIGLYTLSWLLGVNIPYAFIIGMLAGFANLIPFIGPFVGMVPAILAYLMTPQLDGISAVVPVFIITMFLLVQMIDNFFVSPKIMSASVGMHPLVVIVVIMVGNSIMGPLGMLFAVPAFGVIRVTLEEVVWGLKAYHIL